MKTIKELAQESLKQCSFAVYEPVDLAKWSEFLRVAFALRDAEAVPVGYWFSDDPAVCAYPGSGYFPGSVPPNDAVNVVALYPHAPAPSDLQAECIAALGEYYCDAVTVPYAIEQLVKGYVDANSSREIFQRQLNETEAENERLKVAKEAAVEVFIKAEADLRQQLAESQAREKKLAGTFKIYWERGLVKEFYDAVGVALECLHSDDTALREYVEKEVAQWRDAEHSLSAAYLRIRQKLNAFDTPCAPTAEQVWQHTEDKLDTLIAELAALKQQEPFGEVTETGVVWANKNPHAYPVGTKFYTAPATDYKDMAERLLRGAERTVEQVKQRGTALDITPRTIELLINAIAAAKAAGLGEAA